MNNMSYFMNLIHSNITLPSELVNLRRQLGWQRDSWRLLGSAHAQWRQLVPSAGQ